MMATEGAAFNAFETAAPLALGLVFAIYAFVRRRTIGDLAVDCAHSPVGRPKALRRLIALCWAVYLSWAALALALPPLISDLRLWSLSMAALALCLALQTWATMRRRFRQPGRRHILNAALMTLCVAPVLTWGILQHVAT